MDSSSCRAGEVEGVAEAAAILLLNLLQQAGVLEALAAWRGMTHTAPGNGPEAPSYLPRHRVALHDRQAPSPGNPSQHGARASRCYMSTVNPRRHCAGSHRATRGSGALAGVPARKKRLKKMSSRGGYISILARRCGQSRFQPYAGLAATRAADLFGQLFDSRSPPPPFGQQQHCLV
jgi:hypothetical protein